MVEVQTLAESESFRPLVVIPVYNHERGLASMLEGLRASGLPSLLIDDGSDTDCADALTAMVAAHGDWLSLHRLAKNAGKGGAMLAGFRWAQQRGYSHVLQIDADGQHNPAELPRFAAAARTHPQALVLGHPLYADDVPRARLIGRYATHIWVWINTVSFAIRDSMCGLRVYPLAAVQALLEREAVGRRMDFDTEIAVRLLWRGSAVLNLATPVRYPADGVSHFRLWRDNWMISRMHARLFFGMLLRLPRLLLQRPRKLTP